MESNIAPTAQSQKLAANASDTLLTYTFQPPQVFVATTINLKLVIENPAGGNPVIFTGGPQGDEIDITFPVGSGDTDLVNALTFTATSLTSGFTCALASGGSYFAVKSPIGATLQPGGHIEINFVNVVINGATDSPPPIAEVLIQEYIGSDSGSTSVGITKLPATLGIVAWLDPLIIGLSQQSTLYWQSMGGIGVEISGFPGGTGSQKFPVSGQPPYSGNCKVSIGSNSVPQRTYTAKVYTGDNKHTETTVTLTQQPPLILSYTADKGPAISVADTVTLSWSSLYGSSTGITTPVAVINNPISPVQVTPGNDLVNAYQGNFQNMPATVNYPLTVNGYLRPATAPQPFTLSPVGISYFKFGNMDNQGVLSGVMYRTNPANWGAAELQLSNNLNTLTIYQPGGATTVFYLGSGDTTHPQVQYFNAESKGSNQYQLSWVTANLTNLVLNPGNITITGTNIPKGSQLVTLTSSQVYTLTGTAANGQSIVSLLQVGTSSGSARLVEAIAPAPMNDPNCTLTITAGGPIPNRYPNPSARNLQDATDAIAQLTFADLWRLPPFRINQGTVRLDVQGAVAGGGRNWQVQINGIAGASSIAAAVIAGNVANASTQARQNYVASRARAALVASLNTGLMQDVNGPCN